MRKGETEMKLTWWRRLRKWYNLTYRYICCDKPMIWQGNKYLCEKCGKTGTHGLMS
jgi:hypothetical protein